MGIFQSKCKKCGATARDLKNVSNYCRGDKTDETRIDNNYHFFGPVRSDSCLESNCCKLF
jgi:hypothetical protein